MVEDLQEQIKLLMVMIKSVFEYWIPCNNEGIVRQVVEENFSRSGEVMVSE